MKVIGLLSGKGGVGKTSSAINLAAALNHFGKQVILCDANLTTPNVGLYLGTPAPQVTLHHALKGKKTLHDALQRHPSGFHFVVGSLALDDMKDLRLQRFKQLRELDADYVILDGAPGLGKEVLTIMENADELIVVTNPELPAITDALKTVKLAEELGKKILGILVTRVKNDDLDISLRNIEALIEYPIIGVIPEDSTIREAQAVKDAIIHTHQNAPAAEGYLKLAASICGTAYVPERQQNWAAKVWNLLLRKR